MLVAWCVFAALLLVVTAIVHVSTFLGIDPMQRWPGVMFLHLAIFPPFIAALWYASHATGGSKNLDPVIHRAPRWLFRLAAGLFVYAIVNFAIFAYRDRGAGPYERDGKYVLSSHGRVIRELTEDEFHRHRAYVARGFSGHWMLFASASLAMLVGAAKVRESADLASGAPSGAR